MRELSDWSALPNASRAVSAIGRVAEDGGTIMVHGDFDADGMTASAIMVRTLREMGAEAFYYVPSRMIEGYGLGPEGVKAARERRAELVLTVDCGTNDGPAIRELESSGMQVVVTDHHEVEDRAELRACVVNPKLARAGGEPWSELSGAGVALQIARGLLGSGCRRGLIADLAQLAAVGTICDVVPLVDDNRIMVREGLRSMAERPLTAIASLAEKAGVDTGSIKARDIAFGLGPRLNACGRLDRASLGVDLLLSDDQEQTRRLAGELDELNSRRRELDKGLLKEVMPRAAERSGQGRRSLVLSGDGWHRGVLGIVSGRLASRFGMVSVLLSTEDGICYGSARSVPGVPLHEVLARTEPFLLRYGGHAAAAGLSLREENLPAFQLALEEQLRSYDQSGFEPVVHLDGTLVESDLDMDLVEAMEVMRPFGPGNREPVWLVRKAEIVSYRPVGRDRSHLSCEVAVGSTRIRAIGFGLASKAPLLCSPVDLACRLMEDEYRGGGRLQLQLVDLRKTR
jgi:single-stranded-DNA-specific exonuclease